MTFDAAWAVQSALYDALTGDPELADAMGGTARVHDAVPDDVGFPMIQLGVSRMTPVGGIAGGFEHVVRINVYSRWGGMRECKLIAGHVRRLLQNARLTLEGHALRQCRLVFEDVLRVREPELMQASLRYRLVTVPFAEQA
jgi:hypothetical protein